jgi:acyl carrier protein
VAYVVAEQGATAMDNELRSFLKTKLPDYMIPAQFVFLASLPLTSNGKLDRRALPAPDQSSRHLPDGYVAPRTLVEELVAHIWADVLKLDSFGIHDNFFDLGGHSLKATQVISRVRESFRMDLPLRVLFETPTVAELAMRIKQSFADAGEFDEMARCMEEVDSLSHEEMDHQLEKNA